MLQTNHFYSEADLARFRTAYAAMPPHRKLAENRLLAAASVVLGLVIMMALLAVLFG
jgi:restriction endonuclease Mrr